MKKLLVLGAACAALLSAAPSFAQRIEGYDYGWSAANAFCESLRMPWSPFRYEARYRTEPVTVIFARGCRRGFDAQVNANWACQQRLRDQNAYTQMWEARRDACQ